MPLRPDMQLISVDDHLIEHKKVWEDRLPARYREAGPRVVETELDAKVEYGHQAQAKIAEIWIYEGRQYPRPMLDAVAGRKREDYTMEPFRFEDMRPGCFDPAARIADMDEDGVEAGLCFPTFPRFSGTTFIESTDKDLGLLCVQAYNDYVLDEWCAYAPSRLIPLIILPLWDPVASAAEVRRTAANGAKAISFPEGLDPLGLPSFYTGAWDPLLAAAQEADMPLCMHFGTSGRVPRPSPEMPLPGAWALMGTNSMYATIDLLYSPVFHKFPRLKVAMSEGGIGWMPYIIERADYVWERHQAYSDLNRDVRPSELFRKHVWGCFIEDNHGLANRESIGIDRILWEGDYPHSDSNWPFARKMAEKTFADIPDDQVQKIVETNARDLFNFPRARGKG